MISFIIPVYNVESLLSKTVDSILLQATSDIEILLIDDGSTDQSGALCDRLSAQHSCVRVIHQINSGPSQARNTGIEASRGDYLFFMDSDDSLADHAFSAMIQSITDHPQADLHVGQVMVLYLNTMMVQQKISYKNFEFFDGLSGRDALIHMMDRNQFVQSVYSFVISRSLVDSIRLRFNPVWRNFEDFDFTVQAYLSASKITIINQPLVIYSRQRCGQITETMSLQRISSNVDVTYKWIDHCYQQSDSLVYRTILSFLAHNYLFWLADLRKLPKQDQQQAYQLLEPLQVLLRYVKKSSLRPFIMLYRIFGYKAMIHAISIAKHFRK